MITVLRNVILITAIIIPVSGTTAERIRPAEPKTKCLAVRFNDETIKSYYIFIDARTPDEVQQNQKDGKLNGSLTVFFQGHAQRPADAYSFSSEIALRSKSGIVIVPVCDTPYGRDKKWRGDEGKMVILMEVVRYVLHEKGISLKGYRPITDMKLAIDNKDVIPVLSEEKLIPVKIMAFAWSHGCILARQMASLYPDTTTDLAQICPAGYTKWIGGDSCVGTSCILVNFQIECTNIGFFGLFSHPGDVFEAGWGVAMGAGGDGFRSCSSCLGGNFNLFKMFRGFSDVSECTHYIDDGCCSVSNLKSITVIFGRDDTLFPAKKLIGTKDVKNITQEESEAFWSKYYPSAVKAGTHLTLKVMPGDHIAPIVYSKDYADTILKETGQEK